MGIEKVRDFLVNSNFDGILLRKRNNFSWLTDGSDNHIVQTVEEGVADFMIFKDTAYLITSKMEERRIVEEELKDLPFEVEVVSNDWFVGTETLIDDVANGKKMATDSPYRDWENVDQDLGLIRSVLNEREIKKYRELCQSAAKAVEQTCREITVGQTEHEIEALLASKVLSQGLNIQVLLVATDERIYKYRHPISTSKKLDKQAMIVLCAEKGGLVANVTRLVHFGEMSPELIGNKKKAAKIDAVMNCSTKPGKTAGEVIKAGIKQYETAGFPDDWKLLHQGGLTGFASREFLANAETPYVIKENQAYAWNPSLPGVKSEDTILVTDEGIDFMTHTNEWVYQEVEVDGKVMKRPDILQR
ncbi:M24 family metallopeptidase [Pseudalkalibacillus caeni]|uniref:M24 family metallopeptidase n=1 Tax=Exobacillus caeni TaxID=2574798 RepID=A0A5R9F7A3_9BACL|nr:aminopeptidase P family protein [Pseudalkalibacillus caeni]TLS38409.1 M24 family metallopeptidase [Pseudalkalibacillus caeni]